MRIRATVIALAKQFVALVSVGLFFVLAFVAVCAYIVCVQIVFGGNQYFTEKGFEQKLREENGNISQVTYIERNYFYFSRADFVLADGTKQSRCLNTNFLFRYEIFDCEHSPEILFTPSM